MDLALDLANVSALLRHRSVCRLLNRRAFVGDKRAAPLEWASPAVLSVKSLAGMDDNKEAIFHALRSREYILIHIMLKVKLLSS